MNTTGIPGRHPRYQLAAKSFVGTPDEVSRQLDELILTLVAPRQRLGVSLCANQPKTSQPPRLRTRILSLLGLTVCLSLVPAFAAAQPADPQAGGKREPWRDVKFGVALEGYYEWNANEPPDRVNTFHAYDTRANTFGIQQVASVVELAPAPDKGWRYGLRLDLQAGQATETVQGSPVNEPRPEVYRHIWQAFGSFVYPVGRGLRTDFGKFASNLGYETNYAKDDQAFSRGYLFYFLPFYHTGLRVTYPVNEKLSLMYALTNGVQQTEDFNNFKSQQVSATLVPIKAVSWTINYYAGPEQPDGGQPQGPDGVYRLFDTYATWNVTPKISLGVDVSRTTSQMYENDPTLSTDGLGVYGRWQFVPRTAVGVRYERLDDEGLFASIEQLLQEVTLTLEQRLAEGVLARLEYRLDWSDVAIFPSDEGLRDDQPTLLVGAIWWFGNKAGTW